MDPSGGGRTAVGSLGATADRAGFGPAGVARRPVNGPRPGRRTARAGHGRDTGETAEPGAPSGAPGSGPRAACLLPLRPRGVAAHGRADPEAGRPPAPHARERGSVVAEAALAFVAVLRLLRRGVRARFRGRGRGPLLPPVLVLVLRHVPHRALVGSRGSHLWFALVCCDGASPCSALLYRGRSRGAVPRGRPVWRGPGGRADCGSSRPRTRCTAVLCAVRRCSALLGALL
mgnify:CR=1 FL=1